APPSTTRSWARAATSGSRLFISMRSAASCGHARHESVDPRGALISRAPMRPRLLASLRDDSGPRADRNREERRYEVRRSTAQEEPGVPLVNVFISVAMATACA